jgi:peptidyl-prolyl cis-trans isomerase SurA
MRNNIVTQAVIGREVGSHIQPTQDETQKFYDEHKQELEQPEQVWLSEILIAPTKPAKEGDKAQDPTPEELAAAEKKANEVLAELKKGAKFDEEAKKVSDGPTAAQGGSLGAFKRGTLAKELEDKTFAMKSGEISDVIRTRQGFVILKVDQHVQAGIPPLKDVEQNVQEAIYLQKLQPALRTYLTKLREDAFIDIKEGYTDTGASPNETKPIYMADNSKPEGKTGKKKKKHFLLF